MFSIHLLRQTQLALMTVAASALLVSCGQNPSQVQIVKDLSFVTSTNANNEVILSLDVELELGNMALPSLEVPVMHPQNGQQLGTVSLLATMNGTNELGLDINLTSASAGSINNGNANLPNNRPIPVGGIDQSKVLAFPVGQTGIKIYLALAPGMALVGVAVPITQLDSLGKSLGGLNIFPTFNIEGVQGIAGLFTGQKPGQSGLALFADFSKVIDPSDILNPAVSGPVLMASNLMMKAAVKAPATKLYFYPSTISDDDMDVVADRLYQLHNRKAKLKVR